MSIRYLFLDFETTDLRTDHLTVLEASWTVTDHDFFQLTPLRSRLCAIPTDDRAATVPTASSGTQGWSREVRQIVRQMHDDSGLRREWLDAPGYSILRTTADFDRLVADDLRRADLKKTETVFLAGAGVSHFDRPVLDEMCSFLVFGDSPVLHYRAADVSSAVSLLGISAPKNVDELRALAARATLQRTSPVPLWSLRTDEDTADLQRLGGEDTGEVNPDRLTPHRAAPDVAFSLVLARVLRALLFLPEHLAA